MRVKVRASAIVGGGYHLTQGTVLDGEELGAHLVPLLSCGALEHHEDSELDGSVPSGSAEESLTSDPRINLF